MKAGAVARGILYRGAVRTFAAASGSLPESPVFELKVETASDDFFRPPRHFPQSPSPSQHPSAASEDVLRQVREQLREVEGCLGKAGDGWEGIVGTLLEAEIDSEKILNCTRRYPELLLHSRSDLESRMQPFKEIGMRLTSLFEMLLACPEVFGMDFETQIRPRVAFFESFLHSATAAVDLISQAPVVLTYDLDLEIRPKVAYLQNCGCDADEISALIGSYPSILCLSIDRSIAPKIDYLQSRLPEMNIKQAILTFPAFLDMSLEAHIKEKVEFFLDFLEVDSRKFAFYLPFFPQIFSCQTEGNIKSKIEVLFRRMKVVRGKRKKLRIAKRSCLGFMACPSLFGFSHNRLVERVEQIRSLLLRNEDIVDHLFEQCPLLFGCTIDFEDVERVVQSLMDALQGDRFRLLEILQSNPGILLMDPDTISALLATCIDRSTDDLVSLLSKKNRIHERLNRHALPSR